MPGIACGFFLLFEFRKKIDLKKENVDIFLAITPRTPMGSLNEFQPIRSSRLASYSWHMNIYERSALFIRYTTEKKIRILKNIFS